jgi:hypothetical protein
MKITHQWIKDSMVNPLTSTMRLDMIEMNGFHPLQVSFVENIVGGG